MEYNEYETTFGSFRPLHHWQLWEFEKLHCTVIRRFENSPAGAILHSNITSAKVDNSESKITDYAVNHF